MVVRSLSEDATNWRAAESLDAYLKRHGVVGLQGIDTRKLVRHIRTRGAQMGVISSEGHSAAALVERARRAPGMEGQDLVTGISTRKPYVFTEPTPLGLRSPGRPAPQLRFEVVAYDYGLKRAMLQLLVDAGCRVTVVPAAHAGGGGPGEAAPAASSSPTAPGTRRR